MHGKIVLDGSQKIWFVRLIENWTNDKQKETCFDNLRDVWIRHARKKDVVTGNQM